MPALAAWWLCKKLWLRHRLLLDTMFSIGSLRHVTVCSVINIGCHCGKCECMLPRVFYLVLPTPLTLPQLLAWWQGILMVGTQQKWCPFSVAWHVVDECHWSSDHTVHSSWTRHFNASSLPLYFASCTFQQPSSCLPTKTHNIWVPKDCIHIGFQPSDCHRICTASFTYPVLTACQVAYELSFVIVLLMISTSHAWKMRAHTC